MLEIVLGVIYLIVLLIAPMFVFKGSEVLAINYLKRKYYGKQANNRR